MLLISSHSSYRKAALRDGNTITGFVQVMENLESHGI